MSRYRLLRTIIFLWLAIGLPGLVAPVWAQEHSGAGCLEELRAQYADSEALKVACETDTDCQFQSSEQMNASALALINEMAGRLQTCWKEAGLTDVREQPVPTEMKVRIRHYAAQGGSMKMERCVIAELRPFPVNDMTASFRAKCMPPARP